MVNNGIVKAVFVELGIYDLSIHEGYQRTEELNKSHINHMVKNFDPNRLDPLVVGQDPDGTAYWVIDGQHRLEMAKILNKKGKFPNTIACRLVKNDSIIKQGELYCNLNSDRKALSATSKHKAKVFIGDQDSISINESLARYDFKIGKINSNKYSNTINAVTSVKRIYKELTIDEFRRTFRLIRKTWDGKGKSLNSSMIIGLAYLIKRVGSQFSDDDFINKMKFINIEEILRTGHGMSTSSGSGSGKYYAIAILQYYNKQRSAKRIPDGLLFD